MLEDGITSRIRKKDMERRFSKGNTITKDNFKTTKDMETDFLLMKLSLMKVHGSTARSKVKGCFEAIVRKFFMMVVGKRVKDTARAIMNLKVAFMRVISWMI